MEIIEKKKFIAITLNRKNKTFLIYIFFFNIMINSNIYFFWQAHIVLLNIKKSLSFLNILIILIFFIRLYGRIVWIYQN